MRLTAKPRYLLLLHRGNEKSNTVTALVHAEREREWEKQFRYRVSDNASTDGYIHKDVKIPVLASILVNSRLCLKLTYTAEKERAEQFFPAWQHAVLKLGVTLLRTFSERCVEWGRLTDCNWVKNKAHSFILFCNVYIISFTQKWGVCCHVICTKIDFWCC